METACDPAGTRTQDPPNKNLDALPTELRNKIISWIGIPAGYQLFDVFPAFHPLDISFPLFCFR